ncbi:MAG: hypothetical protein M5U26_30440 [Planctomycetota bacterium]|nr:hypothetical protein [Planctomycetota bacterium]
MRHLFALAMLLPLSACLRAGEDEPRAVTFAYKAPAIGQTVRETSELDVRLKLKHSAGAQVIEESNDDFRMRQVKQETALESDARGVTKLKVRYDSVEHKRAGEELDRPLVNGRAYVVTARGGKVEFMGEEARKLHPFELAFLEEDYAEFGTLDPFIAWFDGRKVKVGETLELEGPLGRRLLNLGKDDPEKIEAFTLTLTGTRPQAGFEVGVFKTRLVMSKRQAQDGNDLRMATTFEGELTLGIANAWIVSCHLTGPAELSGKISEGGIKMNVAGSGRVRMDLDTRVNE